MESGLTHAQQFGQYRLICKLAQGGMAEIFLAIQQGPHGFAKVVVLKRVLADLSASDEFARMFLDEARLAARLEHANIVRVYSLGEEDGQYYLAMEYLPGEDLTSIIQQARRGSVVIPPDIAVELILGAAQGLHYAHEMLGPDGQSLNLVHRDVSPSNILVTYQGAVKVLDFGIARAQGNAQRTAVGQVKGKLQYLSPEQLLGGALDRRADVFSLGLVLHELLTGKRLFRRDSEAAIFAAVRDGEIVPPSAWRPGIAPELDAVVMKCLTRDLDKRHQSALELVNDLAPLRADRDSVGANQKLVTFLTSLFGEERKNRKLRLAQGALGEYAPMATADLSSSGLRGFTPVRSSPGFPAPFPPEKDPHAPDYRTPTSGKKAPVIDAEVDILVDDLQPRRSRAVTMALAGAGAMAVLALAVAIFALTRGPATGPAAPAPVAVAQGPKPAEQPAPTPVLAMPTSGLKVGALRFEGLPKDARVKVDGAVVGNPDSPHYTEAGTRQVLVEAAGFQPFETTAEVVVGEVRPVKVAAVKKADDPRGKLEINCTPWCRIAVSGKDTGKTSPALLVLAPGTHKVTLENPPGALMKTISVKIAAGQTLRQFVRLDD